MNTQKQILLIVVLFFTFVGGCAAYSVIDLPVRAKDQAQWQHSQSVERGALLFANNCRTCHGLKGQGGVGLPLNKPQFQDQDPLVLKNTQALLLRTIDCGRAGTLMPAWLNTNGGSLNGEQINHLIDLITDPVDTQHKDDQGNPTSEGWALAIEFGHNLNNATAAVAGGDTLGTIEAGHQVGALALGKLNNITDFDKVLDKGTKLKEPPSKAFPDGRTYDVKKDRETVNKIEASEHIGEQIFADLNNLNYHVNTKTGAFTLLNTNANGSVDGVLGKGDPIPGLFPGDTLALPEGSTYVVRTGDTLQSIADQHGVPVAEVATPDNEKFLNPQDPTQTNIANDTALSGDRTLKLPDNAVAIVQPGQTLGVIATNHGIKPEDLAKSSGVDINSPPGAGQPLKLPAGAKYIVQSGDTLAKVAEEHKMDAAALAQLNGLQPDTPISPQVIIHLPKVDKYVVHGQTLEDIAKGYSNVTKDTLAKANGIADSSSLVRVGQSLKLPEDAWGNAPPTTVNPGTACIENAVPASTFQQIVPSGSATPAASVTPPANPAKDVTIQSHANDWTVVADGQTSDPNKGVVLITKGTAVKFENVLGLHTITLNGKQDGDNFKQGEQRTITFNDAGTFKLTCNFHPDMLADIFVQ